MLTDARRTTAAGALVLVLHGPALAADVGEIALVADPGRDITQSALIGSRYLERAACAFYDSHGDDYDALFVFSAIPMTALTRSQQGAATRSAARGVGRDFYPDSTSRYCSSRLRHAVKMGDLASFSDDPGATYTAAAGFTLSGVELMGHEFGHHWMAGVGFLDAAGERHCTLRAFLEPSGDPVGATDCDGYRVSDFGNHWSYYFHTGSVMYGNTIVDLGGGRFELTQGRPKYSELDQYLMGLRDPSEVSPMFLVDTGPPRSESSGFPVARGQSVIIEGTRVDLTIQDVIAAEGPRVPARESCHWKAAFVVVHEEGRPPTPAELARVDAYRRRWEQFYAEATDRRGSFDTTIGAAGLGTPECPSGPVSPNDAGVEPVPDAGVSPDARPPSDDAAIEQDDAEFELEDAVAARPDVQSARTILTDDCACASTTGGPTWLWLLAAAVFARRLTTTR